MEGKHVETEHLQYISKIDICSYHTLRKFALVN